MTRPLIGISCYSERADYWIMRDDDVVLVPRTYVEMVLAAGGVPVLLAPIGTSFDQFRDYRARGDSFRRAARALAARPEESA